MSDAIEFTHQMQRDEQFSLNLIFMLSMEKHLPPALYLHFKYMAMNGLMLV